MLDALQGMIDKLRAEMNDKIDEIKKNQNNFATKIELAELRDDHEDRLDALSERIK